MAMTARDFLHSYMDALVVGPVHGISETLEGYPRRYLISRADSSERNCDDKVCNLKLNPSFQIS